MAIIHFYRLCRHTIGLAAPRKSAGDPVKFPPRAAAVENDISRNITNTHTHTLLCETLSHLLVVFPGKRTRVYTQHTCLIHGLLNCRRAGAEITSV